MTEFTVKYMRYYKKYIISNYNYKKILIKFYMIINHILFLFL